VAIIHMESHAVTSALIMDFETGRMRLMSDKGALVNQKILSDES